MSTSSPQDSAAQDAQPKTEQAWNPSLYQDHHAFVWQYGKSLLELLSPRPLDRILDLGCGTGELTQTLSDQGVEVVGMDADERMVQRARQTYPHLTFLHADARSFQVESPFDIIFSNAALHWIPEAEQVIRCMAQALKPGGRFVAEFGGYGNVQSIVQAIYAELKSVGYDHPEHLNPWYFPRISEYSACLEQHGFEVLYAALFDRLTPLDGEQGMMHWLTMFAQPFFQEIPLDQRSLLMQSIVERLRPLLYRHRIWYADYRRLRVMAIYQGL